MRSFIRFVLAALLCVTSGPTFARDLKIVFSQYTPPYVFENGSGIVVDIVRAALEPSGYKVVPVYVPIGRGFKMFADKDVDGTTIIQESSGLQAHYSDLFMQYHNRAFSLGSRRLAIRGIKDLQGKTVIGFQNATKYLGAEFAAVASQNPKYKELAQQEAQAFMVLDGRADVAVMDESIFKFYRLKLVAEGKVASTVDYDAAEIFPPTPYKAAFNDPAIRDQFNAGIAAMKADGRYDAIYGKYVEQYFSVKK